MNILGLSAFYHESACCLLMDGQLVAAAAEERFSRIKHDPRAPVEAFRFCLEAGGLSIADLDAVAYYELPERKLARQLWAGAPTGTSRQAGLPWLDPGAVEDRLRQRLGWDGTWLRFPHHLSHAASAFFFSGFEEAALLTVDGVGEWTTTGYGHAEGEEIELFEEVSFPHSLGLLYSTITAYLGFRVNGGEYKVMGLAPYGEPRFVDQICQLVGMGPDGQYALHLRYFDFLRGSRMYSPDLPRLFGRPPRQPAAPIESFHHDVARSLQLVLEEILLEKAAWLHRRTGQENLCFAGGVALNCVANGRLRREGPFQRLFVPPSPGDAGACVGAAALAHVELTGRRPSHGRLEHDFLGPRFETEEVGEILDAAALPTKPLDDDALGDEVAQRLEAGQVVAFFDGAMEFGPRALGSRSLLADPRRADMRERLNRTVKKRETFRPFAPSVLLERASEFFDLDQPSPFMLETCPVLGDALPAITHVDGSARPQTVDASVAPRYAAVLRAFERRTGCPVVVNTSFNVRGEPVVCTPVDALLCFATTDIDTLVLEGHLLDRTDLPRDWPRLLETWERPKSAPMGRSAISEHLYTFV